MKQITIDGIVYNCTPAEGKIVEEKQITKEERFKVKRITPSTHWHCSWHRMEERFKVKRITPLSKSPSFQLVMEEHFKVKNK